MAVESDRKGGLVLVTGGTGFIGRALIVRLVEEGYRVVCLSRSPEHVRQIFGKTVLGAGWDGRSAEGWRHYAEGARAVINLAGENIGAGRWTRTKKKAILESRLHAGQAVTEAVQSAAHRPEVVIQSSAVGYYGSREDEVLLETSSPGDGFLADVVRRWEDSTLEVENLGVRRVLTRSGLILAPRGGLMPRFLAPFRLFVGGPLGRGRQWVSWIHIKDEVRAVLFLMERKDLGGVFNLTAPSPLPMREFCRAIGHAMRRPSWFPVPRFLLRALFGVKVEETILVSQRALPARLLEAGFSFNFPEIRSAFHDILGD